MARNRLELELVRYKSGTKVYYVRGTVAGQRIRRSTGTDQRSAAEKLRIGFEAAALANITRKIKGNRTFAEAAHAYAQQRSTQTHSSLPKILDALGTTRLCDITSAAVRALAVDLCPNAISVTRNRQVIVPIKAIMSFAVNEGWCDPVNIANFERLRAEPKPQRAAIDRVWIDKFVAACDHPGTAAMALTMFTTGARRSDCARMQRANFNAIEKTIYVPTSKNGKAHTFMLTSEVCDMLSALPPYEAEGAGNIFGLKQWKTLYQRWHAACDKAGIKYVPPHQSGRHSFASHLITVLGVDPITVASLGNWDDVSVLVNEYGHSKKMRATVDQLELPEHLRPRKSDKSSGN